MRKIDLDYQIINQTFLAKYLGFLQNNFGGYPEELEMFNNTIYPLMFRLDSQCNLYARLKIILERYLYHEMGIGSKDKINEFLGTLETNFQIGDTGSKRQKTNYNAAYSKFVTVIKQFEAEQKVGPSDS